jgi:hypothetical protein
VGLSGFYYGWNFNLLPIDLVVLECVRQKKSIYELKRVVKVLLVKEVMQ